MAGATGTTGALSAHVWYRSGAVEQAVGVGGQTISFYDANADGVYSMDDDGFCVGRLGGAMSVFARISKRFATSQGVFEIRSLAKDGSSFEYAKASGKVESSRSPLPPARAKPI